MGESESESGGNQLQAFTLLISRYRAARDKGLPTNSILSLSTDRRKPFTSSIEIHNTQGLQLNSLAFDHFEVCLSVLECDEAQIMGFHDIQLGNIVELDAKAS